MAKPVNNTPALVRPTFPATLQSLSQYNSLLNRSLVQELAQHAAAINSVLPVDGLWTPTLTAATPGDLAVAYTTRVGVYTKELPYVTIKFELQTSTWTYTTASGSILINGLPFAVSTDADDPPAYNGFITFFSGFTSANFTHLGSRIAASGTSIFLPKSGSAQAAANSAVTDWPTAGTVRIVGELRYKVNQ